MVSSAFFKLLAFHSLIGVHAEFQHALGRPAASDDVLSLTAVTSDEVNTDARIECWQFSKPFSGYPTVGKAIALADLSNITYVVLPSRSEEGLHHPPSPMLFVLVSGTARVTLPSNGAQLWITQSENQVIVANDIHGVGHNTAYPSDQETVALQLPFKDGKVPKHRILHPGSCAGQG